MIEQSDVTVTQPNEAVFVCTAIARPRPTITWYMVGLDDTRAILSGTEEGVTITEGYGDTDRTTNSLLKFDPTRPFFSSMYVCEATNPVFSAETNATLTVYGMLVSMQIPQVEVKLIFSVSTSG